MVTGYIPSDENKVYMSIYCLVQTKNRFYWVNCVDNSMIGGLTDNPGYASIEEALIYIHGFTYDKWHFVYSENFEDVITVYDRMKSTLTSELKADDTLPKEQAI